MVFTSNIFKLRTSILFFTRRNIIHNFYHSIKNVIITSTTTKTFNKWKSFKLFKRHNTHFSSFSFYISNPSIDIIFNSLLYSICLFSKVIFFIKSIKTTLSINNVKKSSLLVKIILYSLYFLYGQGMIVKIFSKSFINSRISIS